jgi:undecaprenyl-diphosphatase
MTIFAAVVLAVAAGITEIFPVSGTGHLYILAKLLGVPSSGAEFQSLRGMLCLGVAFSGILFYHTQLGDILRENLVLLGLLRPSGRQRGEPFGKRLGQLLFAASLPMVPALLLNPLRRSLEGGDDALLVVSVLICLSGAILFLAARGARAKRTIHQMTLSDAVFTGLIQILSVFPGLSRSGLTVSVMLHRGLDGPAAAEFTGLLSVPVFLAAGVVQLISAGSAEGSFAAAPYLILGFSLSALTGFFTHRFFTDLMARRRPSGFAYWSWGAGILALILFLISA